MPKGNPVETNDDGARFYGIGDQERLDPCLNDCIERWYENMVDSVGASSIGSPVEVTVWRHLPLDTAAWVSVSGGDGPLTRLLEDLAENYSDPEDYSQVEPTEFMLLAERYFVDVVLEEFRRQGGAWRCEPVGKETVDLEEWVRERQG